LDPRPRYFLINSNPAAFQRNNPEIMRHQIALPEADHRFLGHDSVLDCSDLKGGLTASDLEDEFNKNSAVLRGSISSKARRAARYAITHSALLTQAEIEELLALW
jgi:hypothetical protein